MDELNIEAINAATVLHDKYVIDFIISNDSDKSCVYHCYSEGRQYAVKIYKEKLWIEKCSATKLRMADSPYLASVVDVFVYNGHLCVVSPYYAKGSLYKKKFSEQELRDFIIPQINRALYDLHSINLIHGDLKPSNILLSDDGRSIALTDFGQYLFAKDTERTAYKKHLSKEFSSSEALKGDISIFLDYYSFGMCVFMLSTGISIEEHPYHEMSEHELLSFLESNVNKVPLPKAVAEDIKKFILALTYNTVCTDERNFKRRWGFKDVTNWLNGEAYLYPNDERPTFKYDGKPFNKLDDLKECVLNSGISFQALKKTCSKFIDSDLNLNPELEKWLISIGKQPEIEKWKNEIKAQYA